MELEYRSLKPFQFTFDGSMNIAINAVNVYRNSIGFTLTKYDGQTEFYKTYLDKFDTFIKAYYDIAEEHNIIPKIEKVEEIRMYLEFLIEEKILNFSHLTALFLQILILIDLARNIEPNKHYMEDMNRRKIPIFVRYFEQEYPNVFPFTSSSGAFDLKALSKLKLCSKGI